MPGIVPNSGNDFYVLANGFLTTFWSVGEDLGCRNSADFEQKAWAIAHGFGGFG